MLEKVNFPEDLKKLTQEELSILASDIRSFLLEKISKTGGHLASNLGVVELTIALHRFLDCPRDCLVWDVGHQCYVHKILTGRKKGFDSLRQRGGMSGFPDPQESDFDLFKTGHASTSISSAMGLAEANKILKNKNRVFAVIGDGSFTGGLALEAINQIGYKETQMTIVMNDNRMSIAENVGALSRYTKRIEKTELYQEIKNNLNQLISFCEKQGNEDCLKSLRELKHQAKKIGTPGLLFEKLGIHYIGPVDGHNIFELEKAFDQAVKTKGPTLVHIRTQKGMGYQFALDRADKYHGVSPFYVENGNSKMKSEKISFTEIFGSNLLKFARKNRKIIGITASMPNGTGLNMLANELPGQFFDVGICESHAVTFAAGLAKQGLRPVVAIYSSFLQRSLDQIIHDVCLQGLPVIFAIDRAGLVGEDGPTHHGVFDISFLRFIPGLTLMAPRDGDELAKMLEFSLKLEKPVAIRYPRGGVDNLNLSKRSKLELGKAEWLKKSNGKAGKVIVGYGDQVGRAIEMAKKRKDWTVINARFAKPLDLKIIEEISQSKEAIILEENVQSGGFGSAILEELNRLGIKTKVKLLGLDDQFIPHGKVAGLRADFLGKLEN